MSFENLNAFMAFLMYLFKLFKCIEFAVHMFLNRASGNVH